MSSWTVEQQPERIPVFLPDTEYRKNIAELAEFLYDHFQGQVRSKKTSSSESVDSPKPAHAA